MKVKVQLDAEKLKTKLDLKDGERGEIGLQGKQGEKGLKGDKGDKGDIGKTPDTDQITLQATERALETIKNEIPTIDSIIKKLPIEGRLQVVEKINSGKKEDLKIQLKQLEDFEKLTTKDVLNQAVSILDQRTQFLINKHSGGRWGNILGTITEQTDLITYIAEQVGTENLWDDDGSTYLTPHTANRGISLGSGKILTTGTGTLGTIIGNPEGTSTKDFIFGSAQTADVGTAAQDRRMFFDKSKGAFRAGIADTTQWDDVNVGEYSVAFGFRPIASGLASIAIGYGSRATNTASISFGTVSIASGGSATASGYFPVASGYGSMSFGMNENFDDTSFVAGTGTADVGYGQIAMGYASYGQTLKAEGTGSIAMGQDVNALTNPNIIVIGRGFSTNVQDSFNIGFGQLDYEFKATAADFKDSSITTTGTLGAGAITGTSLIKSGGTSDQPLHADGSNTTMQKGSAAVSWSNASIDTTTITFPVAFASAPIVVATLVYTPSYTPAAQGYYIVNWTIGAITPTSFTFKVAAGQGSAGSGTVQWIAWL